MRCDSFGYPVIIQKGGIYVTAGTDRRSSGTHYTPRILTEPIVQYTLEPLVYVGPAEGLPKSEWILKSAKEILALKICDMACGSGAFLVQATRYMAERLLEAWEIAKQANPSVPSITPEGLPSSGRVNESMVPDDPAERKLYAMRLIVQRCIYGVDKNPLAVEMCKLSLWLLTMAKDKPFEFLDHNIRCGDSLVGLHSIDQLKYFSLKPESDDTAKFFGPLLEGVDEAIELRLKLEDLPANTIEDLQRQEQLLAEANEKVARLRCAADMLVAAEFWGENNKDKLERVRHAAVKSGHYVENGPTCDFEQIAAKERRGQSMFHWSLEFPEVIVNRGGFDAFVGNPPFMGGTKLQTGFGSEWRGFIVDHIAYGIRGIRGTADLCAYFLLRAAELSRLDGISGFVTTNTVSQGDTRLVGLERVSKRGKIFRAISSRRWPGDASLQVAQVWMHHGSWHGEHVLDNQVVEGITPYLQMASKTTGSPHRLRENMSKCFAGSKVNGKGFVITREQVDLLISKDIRSKDVIYPYLTGDDINSTPDCKSNRYVINFVGWPLNHSTIPPGYEGPVAADYPACLAHVEANVKPERLAYEPTNAWNRKLRNEWWLFGQWRWAMSAAIHGMTSVLICPVVTKYASFVFDIPSTVFTHKVCVFAFDQHEYLALLNSTIHDAWAREYSSTLGDTLNYAPTSCFETFPFATGIESLRSIGKSYHDCRKAILLARQEGLTKTYNRFHEREESSVDIQNLRVLQVEMDQAVAASYG